MDTNTTAYVAFLPLIIILGLWSAVWKGFALYKAGANKSVPWFVVLFILNTLGILEILYIFVFSKNSKSQPDK
jgi:uncharacterized membrane protein YadS